MVGAAEAHLAVAALVTAVPAEAVVVAVTVVVVAPTIHYAVLVYTLHCECWGYEPARSVRYNCWAR